MILEKDCTPVFPGKSSPSACQCVAMPVLSAGRRIFLRFFQAKVALRWLPWTVGHKCSCEKKTQTGRGKLNIGKSSSWRSSVGLLLEALYCQ